MKRRDVAGGDGPQALKHIHVDGLADEMNGAVAPNGGWFSETMLLALTRYDEGSQLGKSGQIRRIEETLDISQ